MSYRCASCRFTAPKWMGFCPQCGREEPLIAEDETALAAKPSEAIPLDRVRDIAVDRSSTGLAELDRLLGGGVVPGSVILLGGEPGIGKSTLLLQAAGEVASAGSRVLLVSAEESPDQIGLRANRLGIKNGDVLLLSEGDIDAALATAAQVQPTVVIIDSIQSIHATGLNASSGGVAQVRECAARASRFAKQHGIAVFLIGHVTKDGELAGPKLLEHMVDVVLSLEGETEHGLRVLRSMKNRFGATHVAALFEMHSEGLLEVPDPSAAFVGGWQGSVPGTVVFPAVQGRRPVLVEVQALVAKSHSQMPRRSVRGLEQARLQQTLAVLEKHAGFRFANQEVFAGVVGGLRISEPAADLPVALAIVSSLLEEPLGPVAAWGEVGLTGELRPVPHSVVRADEAERIGIPSVIASGVGGPERIVDAIRQADLVPREWRPRASHW